jgi:hypothetical protein
MTREIEASEDPKDFEKAFEDGHDETSASFVER